ncbi:hypothetical protein [Paenibacillus sp. FSL H8-0537]|uniref:hypothetical protein n=1 Tax=Paenibacillus sp. FSL H8-0537 TaxID=2921399 RepID=UPI0031015DB3
MNSYLYGEIIPSISIGKYRLGIKLNELLKEIDVEYTLKKSRSNTFTHVVDIKGMSFFFDFSTEILIQITVSSGYKGKYKGLIGIGSILIEYKEQLLYQLDEDDNDCGLFIPDVPGIWIQTAKWGDNSAPIELISVNKIRKNY